MTLETSHVLMWPYVASADAASVHHASRAAGSAARLPKTLGGGEGGGDGGGGDGDGGGDDTQYGLLAQHALGPPLSRKA